MSPARIEVCFSCGIPFKKGEFYSIKKDGGFILTWHYKCFKEGILNREEALSHFLSAYLNRHSEDMPPMLSLAMRDYLSDHGYIESLYD